MKHNHKTINNRSCDNTGAYLGASCNKEKKMKKRETQEGQTHKRSTGILH